MRLLIDVGYHKLLFPAGCNITAILEALSGAQLVEETGPYNQRVFKLADSCPDMGAKLIQDADMSLPENKDGTLDKLLIALKEAETQRAKVYQLETELKKMREAIAKVDTKGAV